MPEPNTAEVLDQDVAGKVNAEESTSAAAREAGEEEPQANANKHDDENKRKGGWLRKLSKAEQERDFWRDEALRNRGTQAKQETAQPEEEKPPVKPVRPKAKDYKQDEWEKYDADLDKYETERDEYHEKNLAYQLKKAEGTRREQAQHQEAADGWAQQIAEAKEEYADFEDVAFSEDTPMNGVMARAITTSEIGWRIAYELGKHPEEAERIIRLDPVAAIRAIGKIESRIEAKLAEADKEDKEEEPPPAAASRAPRPPTPVRRQSPATSTEPRDEDDWKTWERKRNSQIKARQG